MLNDVKRYLAAVMFSITMALTLLGVLFLLRSVIGQFTDQATEFKKETRTRIAIIDTGISNKSYFKGYLCEEGNHDFTGTSLTDTNTHGTNIAGIIAEAIDPDKECLMIVKYYDDSKLAEENIQALTKSIFHAIRNDASFINISGGGGTSDPIEKKAIEDALKNNIVVIVAAGNGNTNLSKNCNFFPACYAFKDKNFHVVENFQTDLEHAGTTVSFSNSNFGGPVTDREDGANIIGAGIRMSGTSQATALATGRLVRWARQKDKVNGYKSLPKNRKL